MVTVVRGNLVLQQSLCWPLLSYAFRVSERSNHSNPDFVYTHLVICCNPSSVSSSHRSRLILISTFVLNTGQNPSLLGCYTDGFCRKDSKHVVGLDFSHKKLQLSSTTLWGPFWRFLVLNLICFVLIWVLQFSIILFSCVLYFDCSTVKRFGFLLWNLKLWMVYLQLPWNVFDVSCAVDLWLWTRNPGSKMLLFAAVCV